MKKLTNHAEYVLDLNTIDLDVWEDVDSYVNFKIINWYGARIPINRIDFNYSLNKNEEKTTTNLKELITNSYIEGINKYFGNGIFFASTIDFTDITFDFSANENELINNNNRSVSIKSSKQNINAKIVGKLNTNWGNSVFEWIDLNTLDNCESYFTSILETNFYNHLIKYNEETIKFKKVQEELNNIVIDSINSFIKSNDYFSFVNQDFKTNLSTLESDEIDIVWNLNINENVDELKIFNLKIVGNKDSFAVGKAILEVSNYMYNFNYLKDEAEFWFFLIIPGGIFILIIFIFLIRHFKIKNKEIS